MSFNDHQSVQHQMFRMRFTELNEIFAVMSLRTFVTSMIGIFVPIYMYTIGFSLASIFYLQFVMFGFELITEYLAAMIISRFGPKHSIALSMPPLVAHFWMLSTVQTYHWPLWLIAAAGGTSLALYWQGYNYDFSRSKTKNGVTKDISKLYILLAILGAVAPFLGGSIVTYYGFAVLYFIVIFLLLVVFVPLLWFKERHVRKTFKFSQIEKKYIPDAKEIIAYGGAGVEASTAVVIWPLFVYAIVGTAQKVGFVTSVALILTIFVTYFVGKRVNNKNRNNYVKTGGLLDSMIYILVVFMETFGQILSLNFARSLVSSLRSAPFTSEYYLHADEGRRAEHIYIMECSIDIFRIIMFLFLYLSTFILSNSQVLVAGLLIGSVGALFTTFMPRAKCELPYCSNKSIKLISKLRAEA